MFKELSIYTKHSMNNRSNISDEQWIKYNFRYILDLHSIFSKHFYKVYPNIDTESFEFLREFCDLILETSDRNSYDMNEVLNERDESIYINMIKRVN